MLGSTQDFWARPPSFQVSLQQGLAALWPPPASSPVNPLLSNLIWALLLRGFKIAYLTPFPFKEWETEAPRSYAGHIVNKRKSRTKTQGAWLWDPAPRTILY